MKQICLIVAFLLFSAPLLTACSPSPAQQLLDSYRDLASVMERYADDPLHLFDAMDDCIARYQPLWQKTHALDTSDEREKSAVEKSFQMHKQDFYDEILNLVNLDLQIQDQLKNDPELLRAYMERIQKIGRPQPLPEL